MKNFQYYGLFLTQESKNILTQYLQNKGYDKLIKALSNRIYLDHCTLLHYKHLNNVHNLILREQLDKYIGDNKDRKIKIVIDAIGMTDKVFAFRINNINDLCANRTPHITIATRNSGKPVDSNFIHYWKPIEELIIETKLKKYENRRN